MNGIERIDASGRVRIGATSFSRTELIDLLKAWLAISFAFGNILAGNFSKLFASFVIASLTVGVGFIFHELGHKFLAQRYGAWAEFRAWNQMLLMAIIFSFFGFVFAAPGAVMISGKTIGKSRNGKISAMGPLINFIIAVLFLALLLSFPVGIMNTIGSYGFQINTWLGLFNLIPFAMFDGKKIWDWNKFIWIVLVAVGVLMVALPYIFKITNLVI